MEKERFIIIAKDIGSKSYAGLLASFEIIKVAYKALETEGKVTLNIKELAVILVTSGLALSACVYILQLTLAGKKPTIWNFIKFSLSGTIGSLSGPKVIIKPATK